uniref:Coiled-coil domain containing 125 n=1 Tax=Sphenodon punctatus TaxID=8508 RepID=A0A8D0L1F1_SPHPU
MSDVFTLQSKQKEDSEGEDEDMACGDLGNGFSRRSSAVYEQECLNAHIFRSRRVLAKKSFSPFLLMKGEERAAAAFHCSECSSLHNMSPKTFGVSGVASCSRQNSSESNSEMSNEEMRQRLQETTEEVEVLRVELEALQRQLEGKEEALKILQNMAMFEKATSHTKEMLKKTEEQKRALEKVSFFLCKILNQQCLEFLAMLDVKQQKIIQENMSLNKSGFTEVTGLELAVLGACTCNGPEGEPCTCAKISSGTRKQLLQLKQEFELLKKSKEEAYIMADAFRIAFEQQLMWRKDQALRLTQVNKICKKETKLLTWKSQKEDEKKKSLGQKLMGMFVSDTDCKKIEEFDNPYEIIRMLIDLEEALAHQRKVSYMLARAIEEKDDDSKHGKEKKLSEEDIDLKKNQCKKCSESQESTVPAYSYCQNPDYKNDACSISSTSTIQNSARAPKSSHSLPSRTIIFQHLGFKKTLKVVNFFK